MQNVKSKLLWGTAACLLSSSIFACDPNKVTVEDAYVLAGPTGQVNAAGYAVIKNAGDKACTIVGASSAIAKTVEMHTVSTKQGMMKMQPVDSFVVPAKGALQLATGGNHLMFLHLSQPLSVGQTVPVSLQFAGGEQRSENFVVKEMRS